MTDKKDNSYKFSEFSIRNLDECHGDLKKVFNEVIKHIDCRVIEGHRRRGEQNKAYYAGTSHLKFPDSMHNYYPSRAADVLPYPIDWNDRTRMYYFGGFVVATARQMGIKLRWGGDWNGNNVFSDQNFHDLPHFEIVLG